jgi:hypothetical protein
VLQQNMHAAQHKKKQGNTTRTRFLHCMHAHTHLHASTIVAHAHNAVHDG